MAKKKVCVSFDFEHDKSYYYLLEAWNSNPNIDFSINDCTPSEIQSESISKIKQRWTRGYKRYKETSGLIEWKECQIFHSIFT